jgi:hypothetical protein
MEMLFVLISWLRKSNVWTDNTLQNFNQGHVIRDTLAPEYTPASWTHAPTHS